jgi:D-alanine--poly(phosphoribitol) ligase subunit 1
MSLFNRFREIAEKSPSKVALESGHEEASCTYSSLYKLACHASVALIQQGVKKGEVVLIGEDKCIYTYALMLGCIKSGILYANIDYYGPQKRLEKILSNSKPSLVIVSDAKSTLHEIVDSNNDYLTMNIREIFSQKTEIEIEECEDSKVRDGDPLYLMYTSGSTGVPKGVVITHGNIKAFMAWAPRDFGISKTDRLSGLNPLYFDNSVFDFFLSLFVGGTLVYFNSLVMKNLQEIPGLVMRKKCTVWFSVPSLLVYELATKNLTDIKKSNLRRIIFGGEGFPKQSLRELYDIKPTDCVLINVYGPTECTCICSWHVIRDKDFDNMKKLAPLGRPTSGFEIEIDYGEDEKKGVGELVLKGQQVGAGYFNDEERTMSAFRLRNIESGDYERVYYTGDIVEIDFDGVLWFRGRKDFQIKHMGYRIELEEIENAVLELRNIRECVAVYKKIDGKFGQIICYVTTESKINADEYLVHLRASLPDYMLPKKLCILDKMPKNANGKIDRKSVQVHDSK